MARDDTFLDRMSERVMDLESPAYGDERERAVIMESGHFGMTVGLYVGLVGAFVASLFGLILLPVLLLVLTVLPSAAYQWYARKRGVDPNRLAEKSVARSTMWGFVIFGSGMALTFAGMACTVFAGQPLLTAPQLEVVPGEGFLGGMAQGAVVGGILGGLATVVGGVLSYRRANRKAMDGDVGAVE